MGNQTSNIPQHRQSYYSVEYLNGSGVADNAEENLTNFSASSLVEPIQNFSKNSKKNSVSLGNLNKISEPISRPNHKNNITQMVSKMVIPNSNEDNMINTSNNLMSLVRSGGVLIQRNKPYAKPENQVLPSEISMKQLRPTNQLKIDGKKTTWRSGEGSRKKQTEIKIGNANFNDRELIKPSLIKSLIIQSKNRSDKEIQKEPDATSNDECSDFSEEKSESISEIHTADKQIKYQTQSMHDIQQWGFDDDVPKSSIDLRDEIFTELGISCKILHLDNEKVVSDKIINQTQFKRHDSLKEINQKSKNIDSQNFKSLSLLVPKTDDKNFFLKTAFDDDKKNKKKLKSKSFLSKLKSNEKEKKSKSMKLVDKIKSMSRQSQPVQLDNDIQIISRFPIDSKVYRHYISGKTGNDKLANSVSLAKMVKNDMRSKSNDLIVESNEEIITYSHNERAIDVVEIDTKKPSEPVYDSIEECDSTKGNKNQPKEICTFEEKSVHPSPSRSVSSSNSIDTPSSSSSISNNVEYYFKNEDTAVEKVPRNFPEAKFKPEEIVNCCISTNSSGRTTASSVLISSPSQKHTTFVSSINISYNPNERKNSGYELLSDASSRDIKPNQNFLVSKIKVATKVEEESKPKKKIITDQKRLNEIFQDEIQKAYEERIRRFNQIKKALNSTKLPSDRFVNVVQINQNLENKREDLIKMARNHYLEDNIPRFYLRPQRNPPKNEEHEVRIDVPLERIDTNNIDAQPKFNVMPSYQGLVKVFNPIATFRVESKKKQEIDDLNKNIYGEIDLGIRFNEIKKEPNFVFKTNFDLEEDIDRSESTNKANFKSRRKTLNDVFPQIRLDKITNEEKIAGNVRLKSEDWCPASDLNEFDSDDSDFECNSYEFLSRATNSCKRSSEELEEFFFRPCIESPALQKQQQSTILSNIVNRKQNCNLTSASTSILHSSNSSFKPVLPKSQIPKLNHTAYNSLELIDELESKLLNSQIFNKNEPKLNRIYRNEVKLNSNGLVEKIENYRKHENEFKNRKNPLYSSDFD